LSVYVCNIQPSRVVRREFDQAGNPVRQITWSGDPLTSQTAKLLADQRMHVTSFGAADRTVEFLRAGAEASPAQVRVTETEFDGSGRVTAVWSGPGNAQGALDRSQARREASLTYEAEGARVLARSRGGASGSDPLSTESYLYDSDLKSPWPNLVTRIESVPGETVPVTTSSVAFVRDALGRPVEARSSDGRLVTSAYDRAGDLIRSATGAGLVTSYTYDATGKLLKATRPTKKCQVRVNECVPDTSNLQR
jgi:YD repeat-containing protein